MGLRFEWDEEKNRANYRKHRIKFEIAVLVFDNPHFVSTQDREVDGEERWQTIGWVSGVLLLMMAHTLREDGDEEVVRVISEREVTKHERRRYEDGR